MQANARDRGRKRQRAKQSKDGERKMRRQRQDEKKYLSKMVRRKHEWWPRQGRQADVLMLCQ